MSGWIKIHRSITNHWLYTEKRVFSKFEAWNDILLTVNFTDAKTIIKGNLYEVKRGQSILSLDSWSKRWNWDKSKVRRFLNTLQLDNMVVIKSDTVTTQLTVCNYESYQGERNTVETPLKRKRNADETQTTLIEERKEEKESNIEERKLKFAETLQPFLDEYGSNMLNDFYLYWTEETQTTNPKLKFELERTWSLQRRLATWKKQDEKFNPKQPKDEEYKPKFAWQ
jgi:hypothetical protein